MPYHLSTVKAEPARTILWAIALMSLIAQVAALVLTWPVGLANMVIVAPVCIWALIASKKCNYRHMSYSSFAMSLMWLWTGFMRLFLPGVGTLVWIPFIMVGIVMGICYIYFSHHRRRIGDFD